MLFIKFKIKEQDRYKAFQKVYDHMCAVRKPDYQEKEDDLEFDWETATDQQIDEYMDEDRPKMELYNSLFPIYANQFIHDYFTFNNSKSNFLNEDKVSFVNYLEYGFEVDMNDLKILKDDFGIVNLSTGNYPFGGLERFYITLKSFNLTPVECFDGFNVFKFDWTSEFTYETIVLPEKTKIHKEGKDIRIQEESKNN